MKNIIKLLPDNVANQIAAGEVIQRPASVIKELIENSLDAGATDIKVIIKDAGSTSIQIIDNGKGMSPSDARMAFERHATSKISSANDLYALKTMGFRGEALASIAAVAEVELRTKTEEDEIGSKIIINGSKFISQEPDNCNTGANFLIKNLFFNIPARRKFLKSPTVELKHINNEIYRIVLCYNNIKFTVVINNEITLQLLPETRKQRIINVFGHKLETNLIDINTETTIVNIKGFISKPEYTRKTTQEQYFFVNNRYFNHPYFRRAVLNAYEKLIREGDNPAFFIYFDIKPDKIDVNIHPNKTEIKFDEEQEVFQILQATAKRAFGKYNITPNMYFEKDPVRDAHLSTQTPINIPTIIIDPKYNPFESENEKKERNPYNNFEKTKPNKNWEILFENNSNNSTEKAKTNSIINKQENIKEQSPINYNLFLQIKDKYILSSNNNGLIIIHQKRALERILFEKYLYEINNKSIVTQKILFPIIYTPPTIYKENLKEISEKLEVLGFEIKQIDENNFELYSVPENLVQENPIDLLENLLYSYSENQENQEGIKLKIYEELALALAKSISKKNIIFQEEEMESLYNKLLTSSNPKYTPDGKIIFYELSINELNKYF